MEVEENVQLSFWGSVVFAAGTSEEKLQVSKVFWGFKREIYGTLCVFLLYRKSVFQMEMHQLVLGYWRFSQVKVKLKQIL